MADKPIKKATEPKVEEKMFLVKESDANILLQHLTNIPWGQANPIIQHVQAAFKPVDSPAGE